MRYLEKLMGIQINLKTLETQDTYSSIVTENISHYFIKKKNA